MQLNNIGGGHSADMHQVTNCLHSHAGSKKTGGAASLPSLDMSAQATPITTVQQEGQFSLSAWLENTLGKGKRLLQSIWGSSEAVAGEVTAESGETQVVAQLSDGSVSAGIGADVTEQNSPQQDVSQMLHTPRIAAAATAITQPPLQNNPYFSAVETADGQSETLWQKMKVKFKDVAGRLAGHLPGRFFNAQTKGSFQAKQEHSKEDLRKRSKFRRDELEIDCVLTDDSYLLDSYDRKGEYSKLSTKSN